MAKPLLVLGLAINAITAISIGQFIHQDLDERSVFAGGGWALSAAVCPNDAPQCGDTWCCPSSQTCVRTGDGISAEACCPGDTPCTTALEAIPFCANTDWGLWNQTNLSEGDGYFCCLGGQVGTNSGDCLSPDTVLAATLSAVLVAAAGATPSTPISTAPSSGSSTSPPGSSAAGSTTAAAGSSTSATTSSSGENTSSSSSSSVSLASSTGAASGGSVSKKSSGLSTGAAAGIGVGATVVGIMIIAAIIFWFLRRRRSKGVELNRTTHSGDGPSQMTHIEEEPSPVTHDGGGPSPIAQSPKAIRENVGEDVRQQDKVLGTFSKIVIPTHEADGTEIFEIGKGGENGNSVNVEPADTDGGIHEMGG